jgi:hypothetical protein
MVGNNSKSRPTNNDEQPRSADNKTYSIRWGRSLVWVTYSLTRLEGSDLLVPLLVADMTAVPREPKGIF